MTDTLDIAPGGDDALNVTHTGGYYNAYAMALDSDSLLAWSASSMERSFKQRESVVESTQARFLRGLGSLRCDDGLMLPSAGVGVHIGIGGGQRDVIIACDDRLVHGGANGLPAKDGIISFKFPGLSICVHKRIHGPWSLYTTETYRRGQREKISNYNPVPYTQAQQAVSTYVLDFFGIGLDLYHVHKRRLILG